MLSRLTDAGGGGGHDIRNVSCAVESRYLLRSVTMRNDHDDTPIRTTRRRGFPVWAWLLIGGGVMFVLCSGVGIASLLIYQAKRTPWAEAKFTPPKKFERPSQTLAYLRSWLEIKQVNDRAGLPNPYGEAEYKNMPDLPYIRSQCAERFGGNEMTLATADRLQDWICTTYNLTQQQALDMPLEEVAARLRFTK